MNAQDIRCQSELEIYNRLLKNSEVKRINELIAKKQAEGPTGLRRRLLATSVRLSRSMAPDIHNTVDECSEKLVLQLPVEHYVFASPQFNAMCFKPEEGRLFLMFSSSLLEAFDKSEMKFVIGHELGHHIYGHHDIPIGYLLRGQPRPDPRLALDLFTWSRYAEISADRSGAHCTQNLVSVARALYKLSSGLSGKVFKFDLDEFLNQIDDMQAESVQSGKTAPMEDWFSTHPFSPLRVKALKLFDQSELARADGTPKIELEIAVQGLMSFMEPSYMEGKSETAIHMRRLLYTGAIMVADASGGISREEIDVFEKFFGKREFSNNLDIQKLKASLAERVKNVMALATITQRMQIISDLVMVSKASGQVTNAERKVLEQITTDLEIPLEFISQALDRDCEMD